MKFLTNLQIQQSWTNAQSNESPFKTPANGSNLVFEGAAYNEDGSLMTTLERMKNATINKDSENDQRKALKDLGIDVSFAQFIDDPIEPYFAAETNGTKVFYKLIKDENGSPSVIQTVINPTGEQKSYVKSYDEIKTNGLSYIPDYSINLDESKTSSFSGLLKNEAGQELAVVDRIGNVQCINKSESELRTMFKELGVNIDDASFVADSKEPILF